MIDSTNIERISEAHEELAKLMAEKRLRDALLLIYANKQVHVIYPGFCRYSSPGLLSRSKKGPARITEGDPLGPHWLISQILII